MKSITVALAALMFGFGCSHSTPKPEPQAAVLASASRRTPPPRAVQHTEESSEPQTPPGNDTTGNAIFFDFDSATLRQDARPTLQGIGKQLAHARKSIRIEGNCDERGTTEYNIALGDRRAREAKVYLERLGVPGQRISVVSYGSERPKYQGHDESAYAKNRRDDLVMR